MVRAEAGLEAVVESWLVGRRRRCGGGRGVGGRGAGRRDAGLGRRQGQASGKIREAKAALEAEARDAAARAAQTRAPKRPGPKPKPPADVPADKAQRNFTDPESRILKTKDGFIQGYNAQAAVDAKRQIIVAHALTDSTSDQGQPRTPDRRHRSQPRAASQGDRPTPATSKANLEAADRRGKPYSTGRQKHGQAAAVGPRAAPPGGRVTNPWPATLRRAMAPQLATPCASDRPSSRCSARSTGHGASVSSCCAAVRRSHANGR